MTGPAPSRAPLSVRYDSDRDGQKYAPLARALAAVADEVLRAAAAHEQLDLAYELHTAAACPDPVREQLVRLAAAAVQRIEAIDGRPGR